jgi:hypothetical protein
MRRALVPAFLLLLGSAVLGATVFHEPIASAAGSVTSVLVSNSKTSPIPVQEQNLDGANIRVHEEGTANVNVTNTSLPVQGTLGVRPAGTPVTINIDGAGYVVPAGKHLVVTYISGQSDTTSLGITNLLNGGGFLPNFKFPTTMVADGVYYLSEPVTIFADAGDKLQAVGGNYPSIWASGYLGDQ